MDENKKGTRFLKRLAQITDLLQETLEGRATVVYELNENEYQKVIDQIENADWMANQFKVEISGTDFIFLLQKSSPDDTEKI